MFSLSDFSTVSLLFPGMVSYVSGLRAEGDHIILWQWASRASMNAGPCSVCCSRALWWGSLSVLARWGLLTCGWLRVASREIMLISTPDICGRGLVLAVSCLHALLPMLPTQTSASPPDTLWALSGAHRIQACPSLRTATADSKRTSLVASLSCPWHVGWDTETDVGLTPPSDCTRERLLTPKFMGLPRCQGVVGTRHFRSWFCHYWLPFLCFFSHSAMLGEVVFH